MKDGQTFLKAQEKQYCKRYCRGRFNWFEVWIFKFIAVLLAVALPWSMRYNIAGKMLKTEVKGLYISLARKGDVKIDEENNQGDGQPKVEVPEYESLYPALYAPEVAYSSVNKKKVVYLTFDDGPSGRTSEILDILDEFQIKATFFVVGKTDEKSAERMREIVSRGHTLGMHTYSHNYAKVYETVESFFEDYNEIYHLIKRNTGVSPTIFRFPGGSVNDYNTAVYESIVAEMTRRGFVYFDWNVQTGDAANPIPSISDMVKNGTAKIGTDGRVILLMHDSVNMYNTVEALPRIIQAYKKADFTFEVLTPEVVPIQFSFVSDLETELKQQKAA